MNMDRTFASNNTQQILPVIFGIARKLVSRRPFAKDKPVAGNPSKQAFQLPLGFDTDLTSEESRQLVQLKHFAARAQDTQPRCSATYAIEDREAPHPTATQTSARRLLVVRVQDANLAANCAGRMTITGRIADVCAELDRMERTSKRDQPI